jgi:hypothetical protein
MTPILAQMDDDSIGSGDLGHNGGGDRVRLFSPASLPQGGDMVNVYRESGQGSLLYVNVQPSAKNFFIQLIADR